MYNIIHISFHHLSTPHGRSRAHKWPTSNVSGFIAQLVKASNRCREVTGSNPVEVLFAIAKITTFFAGFVIYYTFWTKRQNCKAIYSMFWPVLQYDAPVCGTLGKFFFTNHPPIRVCESDWQSRLLAKSERLSLEHRCIGYGVDVFARIVKCESLLPGHGKVHFIVSQSKMFLIGILRLRWPRATVCVNSCMFHGIEHVM